MKWSLLEHRPIKIMLVGLVFLEVLVIAAKYHINFDTYMVFIMILLALPLSMFSLRYFLLINR
jgi:hypothetical protein